MSGNPYHKSPTHIMVYTISYDRTRTRERQTYALIVETARRNTSKHKKCQKPPTAAREQASNGVKGIGDTKGEKLIITKKDEEILDQTLVDNMEANNNISSATAKRRSLCISEG